MIMYADTCMKPEEKSMHKLSIVTVCFNSEKTIEETIKSIVCQKNDDIEYIIIDGKSTDGTMEIINRYKEHIDKIISERDGGISDAFNKGIRLADGEFIGIVNSDDMLLPWAAESVIDKAKPDTDVFYGQGIRYFSEDKCKRFTVVESHNQLHTSMPLCHPATFVRKSAYEKWGGFSNMYKYTMDRELLLRMLDGGAKFQYSRCFFAVYRMGGASDETYLKGVLPEMSRINRDDGMLRFKVSVHYIYDIIFYYLLQFRNRVLCDKKLVPYKQIFAEVRPGKEDSV
jgi:Glycosyltransferases involved in cell wall biogenesis